MARRDLVPALKAFAEIRRAQTAAARSRLAAAQAAEARAQRRLDAETDRQAARRDAWAGVVAAPRVDLMLAMAWGAAIRAGEDRLDQSRNALQGAGERCESARQESRLAEARSDSTQDLARSAERRARRRVEDTRIAEAEDAFLRRRPPA